MTGTWRSFSTGPEQEQGCTEADSLVGKDNRGRGRDAAFHNARRATETWTWDTLAPTRVHARTTFRRLGTRRFLREYTRHPHPRQENLDKKCL